MDNWGKGLVAKILRTLVSDVLTTISDFKIVVTSVLLVTVRFQCLVSF